MRTWDPSSVPDSSVFPGGAFELEIEELNEEASDSGKAMYRAVLRSQGPSLVGVPHFENYVLGSDEDPNADDPATMAASMGARNLKRLLKKAGVEMSSDLDDDCARAIGQHVIGVFTQFTEPDLRRDGTQNQYAGQIRNRVQVFALGERELGEQPGVAPVAPAPRQPRAPAAVQPRPAHRAAAPAPRAAAPPARPAPAPATRPAAPPPPRAAAPAPRAAAPRAAASRQLKCTVCQEMVSQDEFGAHIAAHEAEE